MVPCLFGLREVSRFDRRWGAAAKSVPDDRTLEGVQPGELIFMRTPWDSRVTRDVSVPMRDGTVLYADVYRQDNDDSYPVLLQRTPYNKQDYRNGMTETDIFDAVGRGYVVVIQDCRGRYTSDGEFKPFHQEFDDG